MFFVFLKKGIKDLGKRKRMMMVNTQFIWFFHTKVCLPVGFFFEFFLFLEGGSIEKKKINKNKKQKKKLTKKNKKEVTMRKKEKKRQ